MTDSNENTLRIAILSAPTLLYESKKGEEQMPARTGRQYLKGLVDDREVWFDGERIHDVMEHPMLSRVAHTIASLLDAQYQCPETMLMQSPDTNDQVGVTHIVPRTLADLQRRRKAIRFWSEMTVGMLGRSPDYLNVTIACFAGRPDVWARRGNERGAENILNYHHYIRENDLILTHAIVNPQVDRSREDTLVGTGEIALHKVGETADAIIVRGARMLATLAPFSDELVIYPNVPIRVQDTKYALCFALPISTPGLKFICRDSFVKERSVYDYPLSSRFDEMDAFVIFDDVHVPKDRVFLDGDAYTYSEVTEDTNWRAHFTHQAMIRAWTKLEFCFGLGHMLAETTGVNAFDHIQEKLGEMWTMAEMARSGIMAAESCATLDQNGIMTPDARPLVALRNSMPKWMPRANELLQLIGGGGLMCTPSEADINGPMSADIKKYFQGRNADAERRIRIFRLAWDFLGSDLGGRSELFERFYIGDSFRGTMTSYKMADKTEPVALAHRFLMD